MQVYLKGIVYHKAGKFWEGILSGGGRIKLSLTESVCPRKKALETCQKPRIIFSWGHKSIAPQWDQVGLVERYL